jgi:undecaprenyl-diphosphatase
VALTVVVAGAPRSPAIQPLDDAWNRWMVAHRTGPATAVALTLSFVGSAWVAWPVRFVAAWVLAVRRRYVQLAAFAIANLVAQAAVAPMKALIGRPRPLDPLVATRSAAFPSGHAIAAAVTAFGLVAAFVPRGPGRVRWTGVAATFAASMALSRTYLAAHWLSDTVAGICFGVGLALGTEALLEPTATAQEREDRVDA